jgi:exodeoxyribonuclease VII small subunit
MSDTETADSPIPLSFEEALEELESLVTRMESGNLTLDDSLKAFERGVQLTRHCQTALKNAEQRVQILTDEGLINLDDNNLDDP